MIVRQLEVGTRDVQFGENVTVVAPSNLYECAIGSNSFIGPFTEIQRGVVIGENCRIQSHSFICELVRIGNGCTIAHGVMFTNDRFRGGPARGDTNKWEATVLGDRVSVGSGTSLLPISVCNDVVIGAGSVVTKNITEPGTYAGNPARRIS